MKRKIKIEHVIIAIIVAIVAFGVGFYVWRENNRPKFFEMYIFNMKSGNSIFIRTPNDKRVLINGGANGDIIRRITSILPFYSRKIDTTITTDTAGKDVSGLIDVVNRYDVEKVYIPSQNLQTLGLSSTTDEIYTTFVDTVNEKGIVPIGLTLGDQVSFDSSVVNADIVFPASSSTFAYSKASAPETIMRINSVTNAIFLLGNATPKIQKFIASEGTTTADVLITWNNASPDNLAENLMDQLHPKYLIYSKSLTASGGGSQKTSKKPKKIKNDPLAYILPENRFNIREFDCVKITVDGKGVRVEGVK